ncbi:hypothetical protein [Ensifer sp. 4252]|uniref:hypothetical protein n=1 Tax=Ensifer sp. 4252 TaxID=3373915 RepID=UPI003D1DE246
MEFGQQEPFSRDVIVFHGRWLPIPIGYAELINAYDLNVPMPITLTEIGDRHKVYQADGWNLDTPRHQPDTDPEAHLVVALRYEGLASSRSTSLRRRAY